MRINIEKLYELFLLAMMFSFGFLMYFMITNMHSETNRYLNKIEQGRLKTENLIILNKMSQFESAITIYELENTELSDGYFIKELVDKDIITGNALPYHDDFYYEKITNSIVYQKPIDCDFLRKEQPEYIAKSILCYDKLIKMLDIKK